MKLDVMLMHDLNLLRNLLYKILISILLNKFNFQFSNLTDTDDATHCNRLLKYRECYATHKSDVGKIANPFRIRLKSIAQLDTQRPSNVPIHCRDKFNILIKELEKHNIKKQIGSSPKTNQFMAQLIYILSLLYLKDTPLIVY